MQDLPKSWYVLYTKYKAELLVAEQLKSIGFNTFAPTKTVIKKWSDRKKKVKVPLLPSMVLVSVTPKNFNKVFDVPGVIRYLFIDGKKAIVRQEEIDAMKHYLSQKYNLKNKRLAVGQQITVPHLDATGELLRIEGKKCFVLLEKLGYKVSFQLS
mgnify:CR=1 FL=1|tara:strand:- start:1691 stop:2155 length:465 start_codon:yes stop_codon:yes gene_type:complete